jgi:hypothetical protein
MIDHEVFWSFYIFCSIFSHHFFILLLEYWKYLTFYIINCFLLLEWGHCQVELIYSIVLFHLILIFSYRNFNIVEKCCVSP